MGTAVLHFRKIKTSSDLAGVASHNSRAKVIDDAGKFKGNPPDWMKNPQEIRRNEGQTGRRDEGVGSVWSRIVDESNLQRRPQKNASKSIEAVFTASKDSFKKYSEWKAFLSDCREWGEKKFGKQNVLQWNTHYDETVPHLHVLFVPIVRDPQRGNRYSSGDFLGGPEGLRNIQTEFYEQVGKKYGIDRGQEGSQAKHTDQSEWKSELVQKEKAIIKKLEDMENYHREQKELAERRIKELDKRESEMNEAILKFNIVTALHEENAVKPEIDRFWTVFFRRLPDVVKETLREERLKLKKDY